MKFKKIYIILAAAVLLAGCHVSGEGTEKTSPPARHTLIMYFMGQNSLDSFLANNIEQVLRGVTYDFPDSSDIYIFFERNNAAPALWKVDKPSKRGEKATQRILKQYEMELNGTDPATMNAVLEDVLGFEETPAQTYGLVVSSHGSGWLPASYSVQTPRSPGAGGHAQSASIVEETGLEKPEGAITRWIGEEIYNGAKSYMGTDDLIAGMAPIDFDYIIFDACFMSSIEALYELRDHAKYIIASPTEIMGYGFPMHYVVPVLFNHETSLMGRMVKAGDEFYRYYASGQGGYQSASIAVVDCGKLEEFSGAVRVAYDRGIRSVEPEWIQHLETVSIGHTFHDLEDFLYSACALRSDFSDIQYRLYNEVMLYRNHTDKIYSAFGGWFEADYVCGISVFIPRPEGSALFPLTTMAWYETEWAKAIGATP